MNALANSAGIACAVAALLPLAVLVLCLAVAVEGAAWGYEQAALVALAVRWLAEGDG